MGRENALKDYVEVNVRIEKFYELYPKGRILTELISWENEIVIMKATTFRDSEDDKPSSTGHAYEKEGSSFINKTSALENCETSAVGRALAILGFEIKKSVASKEEVANAKLNQNSPLVTNELVGQIKNQWIALGYEADMLNAQLNKTYKSNITELTLPEANEFLSKLKSQDKSA